MGGCRNAPSDCITSQIQCQPALEKPWAIDRRSGRRTKVNNAHSPRSTALPTFGFSKAAPRQGPELAGTVRPTWLEDLWQRVHRASTNGPARGARAGRGASPKTLFGGLLRCHTCAGAIVAIDSRHYGCSVHKDRGAAVCANGSTWRRALVDRRLVAEVRDELLRPEAIAELQRTIRVVLAETLRADAVAPDVGHLRLRALQADIGRLVDAVAQSGYSAALAQRLQAAEAEQAALEAELARLQAPALDAKRLADEMVTNYRQMMLQLQEALCLDDDRQRMRRILADLLGDVTLLKDEGTGESFAEFEEPAERLLLAVSGQPLGRVARAGFEPATFGL
jgi:site-specific DNA recombinase